MTQSYLQNLHWSGRPSCCLAAALADLQQGADLLATERLLVQQLLCQFVQVLLVLHQDGACPRVCILYKLLHLPQNLKPVCKKVHQSDRHGNARAHCTVMQCATPPSSQPWELDFVFTLCRDGSSCAAPMKDGTLLSQRRHGNCTQ